MLDDTTIPEFLRDDYPRLVNAVALVTNSRPGAEDAVQEALVRAWIRTERGEEIESLANWVVAVALNGSRSGVRRLLAERRAHGRLRARAVKEADSDADDRVDIGNALTALPRRQREVAVLRYFLDMSTIEVASALGVSDGTVKNSLAKARATLAQDLRIDDEAHDVQA